jgi:hypothetical protein
MEVVLDFLGIAAKFERRGIGERTAFDRKTISRSIVHPGLK